MLLRHADTRLQTRLTPPGLQKRLLDLYNDARVLEEEQGVNILFLALGALKWVDPANASKARYAPLVLVPVGLERGNVGEKFKLRARPEDVAPNLSLEAFLLREHRLKLPTFEASEDFGPQAYMSAVAGAVDSKPGWEVTPDDMVLGFFSFAKFLMYRDLDPGVWPRGAKLDEHAIIRPLVSDGFEAGEPLLPEETPIDPHIPPASMVHIVDSDSSQTLAVHEVRRGRNLVIQGPPGTGKSQTIANVIASAVADGKTVLFVAEKMAALEVVKRRLDSTGVGDACLELHSNKANKRAVLEDLRRTWELGAPRGEGATTLSERLREARDALNAHAERMHTPRGSAGFTPYEAIGHLTRLKAAGQPPTELALVGVAQWSAEALSERRALVVELAERVADLGPPSQHPWRGVDPPAALPADVDRLTRRLARLCEQLRGVVEAQGAVALALEMPEPTKLSAADAAAQVAERLAGAPDLPAAALGAPVWSRRSAEITALVRQGARHAELADALATVFRPEAWTASLDGLRTALADLPDAFPIEGFTRADVLATAGPELLADARRLAEFLGRAEPPQDLDEVETLATVGLRVASAPSADPQAFAADLWDTGVERAADLAAAVRTLEDARGEIGSGLSEAAWSADLSGARRTLAAHGTGVLRFLSGEWRAANRLVRSFQADPKLPLDRRVALLDALARGQAAAAAIREEASFGASAFGADWRGERSASVPLVELVEWMRSLRGLGAEPRMIAARGPDRRPLGELAHRVAENASVLRAPLKGAWEDLGERKPLLFGPADPAGSAALGLTAKAAASLVGAHRAAAGIALTIEPDLCARRARLAELAEGQTALAAVTSCEGLGAEAFSGRWRGLQSDWPALSEAASWIRANLDINGLASRVEDRAQLSARAADVVAKRDLFLADLDHVLRALNAEGEAAITLSGAREGPIDALTTHLMAWRDGGEALTRWTDFRARVRKAQASGLADLVLRLEAGSLAPQAAVSAFDQAVFEVVLAEHARVEPELMQFDGELHDRAVERFGELDRERIRLAALEVMRRHYAAIPPQAGALGPVGVLKGQIALKRGHLAIRKLMERAAPAVQAIKPVFMMSPLSVAQFLPPGALSFDLLVMDEASQIQPVDALGAIARCKQVVVVGDPEQLPPTAFFAKMTGGADDDDDDATRVADIESILGLFEARGLPKRMLRWHYRSRHQSLIAVSNRLFYRDKLFIPPSPYTAQAGLGLRFHFVADGLFETGKTRTNPREAQVVARAVVDHAIHPPEHTLGVVAFSSSQKRAIQDQVELLRRQLAPEHEAFFRTHAAEPFFIKNLENVQGDERDVIMISVGYGPSAPGQKPKMYFGPLGSKGGERRLNVLISRAKRRCEVFASMTDEDIDAEFARSRDGVRAFKIFLHFARTGKMDSAEVSAVDRQEVFEAQVAQALHEKGWVVQCNVGVSGIFVPVAVADPERPDRYLLAVECDGGAYRDARSARDRDRLRTSVLEDHGWAVHRVWSADWLKRPKQQLERVLAAIEAAQAKVDGHAEGATSMPRDFRYASAAVERESAELGAPGGVEEDLFGSAPYQEAVVTRPAHLTCELHNAPYGVLSELAEQVVAVEGPVHVSEVAARIREAWGLHKTGSRILDAVTRALDVSVRMGRLVRDGDFYAEPGVQPVVRDRGEARSPTLRKPDALPPAEIAAALVEVLGRNFGATEEQAIQAVSRALGFRSTSAQIRETIETVLRAQLISGVLMRRDALVDLGPNAPTADRRRPPTSPLESLVAEGEHERLEFKETLRWDVRQAAVNKKLPDSSLKAIAAFANHRGGTLLIGVRDDGSIPGLEPDLASFGGSRDRFELHLTELIKDRFSESFRAGCVSVTYPITADLKTVCRVDVRRSRVPVYLNVADGTGAATERLIVRTGASSPEIPLSQVAGYVREHFSR